MWPLCVLLIAGASPERAELELLTNLMTSALAEDAQLDVLSSSDLRALLDVETEKQEIGCDDNSCLGELADAMGARFVVAPDLGVLGSTRVLTITVFDIEHARAIERRVVEAGSAEALGRSAADAVRGLVRVDKRERVLVLDARAVGSVRGAAPESEGSPLLVGGLATVGVGAAALAGGVAAYLVALSLDGVTGGTQIEVAERLRTRDGWSITGATLLGISAVTLTAGGVLTFLGVAE